MDNYKYKAFISYRHKELDKEVAIKLQKKLEKYKIPKKFYTGSKSWKVFRDETELAANSSLSDEIKSALEQSEFLIVLCSIDTAQSRWCIEEINYFKEIHNNTNNNIITVLINGEPNEVFPEAIRTTVIECEDRNGNTEMQEKPVEPLAVNIRDKSDKLTLKKLNVEFLRIVAPLLGCGYDDLYRRSEKRKMQKITIAFTTLILFVIYSCIMLMQINNQKNELQTKNKELEQKTTELNTSLALVKEKTGEIEDLDLSIAVRESKIKYADGDITGAVKYLVDAFPKTYDNSKFISEAEYTLAEQMQAFNQKIFARKLTLEHSNPVSKAGYVGEGKNIITQDSTGTIYLWDAVTAECKKTFTKDDFGGCSLNLEFENKGMIENSQLNKYAKGEFRMDSNYMILGYEKEYNDELPLSGTDFYISTTKRICKFNGKTGDVIWDYKNKHNAEWHKTYFYENYIVIIYSNSKKMEILEPKRGTIIKSYNISPEARKYFSSLFTLLGCTDSHCYASIETDDVLKENLCVFEIISDKIVKPQVLNKYSQFDNCYVKDSAIIDGKFYTLFLCNNNITSIIAQISCYNDQSLEEEWSYKFKIDHKGSHTRIGKLYASDAYNYCDIIFVINGNKIVIIDSNSGKCLKEYVLNEAVVESYYSKNGYIYNITKNGMEIALLPRLLKREDNSFSMYKVHDFATNVNLCGYYNNSYITVQNNSDELYNANKAYIYSDIRNIDFHELYSDNDTIADVVINDDGNYIAYHSNSDKNIYVYNFLDGTIKKLMHYDGYTSYINFIEHDKICIMTENYIFIYDLTSMDKSFSYNTNDYIFPEDCYSSNGTSAVILDMHKAIFIRSDGNILEWKPKSSVSETSTDITNGLIEKFSLSKTGKKSVALIEYYRGIGKRLEVYDTVKGTTVILDKNINQNDKEIEIVSFAWLNDSIIAICFNNQSIGYFDTETGKCVKEISLNDIGTLPITMVSLEKDENIMLLCNNAKLYQINMEGGIMDETIDLPGFLIDNIEYASENKYFLVQNGKNCIFGCDYTQQAWVFNAETFSIRYYIDNYKGYNSANNQIIVNEYNKIGTYPLYTTEQLLHKAKLFSS